MGRNPPPLRAADRKERKRLRLQRNLDQRQFDLQEVKDKRAQHQILFDKLFESQSRTAQNMWEAGSAAKRWVASAVLAANLAGLWFALQRVVVSSTKYDTAAIFFLIGAVLAILGGMLTESTELRKWLVISASQTKHILKIFNEDTSSEPVETQKTSVVRSTADIAIITVAALLQIAPVVLFIYGIVRLFPGLIRG